MPTAFVVRERVPSFRNEFLGIFARLGSARADSGLALVTQEAERARRARRPLRARLHRTERRSRAPAAPRARPPRAKASPARSSRRRRTNRRFWWKWSRRVRTARLRPAAEGARGRHDEPRLRIEVAGSVALRLVLPAAHERVELDRTLPKRRELARGRDEDARATGEQQRVGVARAEVDGVASRELVPRERVVVAAWMELPPDRRDRPLTALVDEA